MINGHAARPPHPTVGPEPTGADAVTKPKRAKKQPAKGAQRGTWFAVVDHLARAVPVPGVARTDGREAMVKGAELLAVKVEYIRIEWRPA